MFIYIKLAVRNVHKNLRSLSLNGAGIMLTVISVVFILSFSRGIERGIVDRNIAFETGAVTIKIDKEIAGVENRSEGDAVYQRIIASLNAHPSIRGYRPRLSIHNASLYSADNIQRIGLEGLTPEEYPVLNEMMQIVEGDTDWDRIPNGLLISTELAETTALALLDECSIMLPSADGSINVGDFVVTGIFQNTSQANKFKVFAAYDEVKSLYNTNLPSRILTDVTDLHEVHNIARTLSSEIRSEDIEIETYKDHLGSARALSAINRNAMGGMAFFLLFISFVGIWAMQVEQINERRKEIGTLLTFGFGRRAVKRIFLLEAVYVSLLFLIAGLAVALTIIGVITCFDGVYLGRLASFAFGSSTILPVLAVNDMVIVFFDALLYPLFATWISLQSIRRMPVIRLLNERYE